MRYVLWIDDDFRLLQGAHNSFQKFDAHVTFAPDICSAIEHLSEAEYDVVLIDAGIDTGNLGGQFPHLSEHFLAENLGGLDLIRLLVNVGIPDVFPAVKLILCSGHPAPVLGREAPDVLALVRSIPKLNAFHRPDRFVEEVFLLLENPTDAEVSEPIEPSDMPRQRPDDASGREAEWRLHDLRNEVSAQLAPLRRTQEQVRGLRSGADRSTGSVRRVAQALSTLEGEILDALVDADYAHRNDYARTETELKQLAEELGSFQPAKITMVADITDQLLDRLLVFPRYSLRAKVEALRQSLNVELISHNLEVVIDSLAAGVSSSLFEPTENHGNKFDTSKIIQNLVQVYSAQAMGRKIEFELEITDELFLDRGSFYQYRRIFSNVIGNAVKFNGRMVRENTWIEVKHYLRDGRICTEVESWGPSKLEDASTSTVEGVRGDDANRPGQGLGLAIALKEVELLGGDLKTNSRGPSAAGKYTNTVVITIPIDSPTPHSSGR